MPRMTDADDKQARIVAARMRLKARFEAEMARTPAVSDSEPQGSGPINRHGMPKLPVGQVESKKWPVLDLGTQPSVAKSNWELRIDGACAHPVTLDWRAFLELPQTHDTSDFHCVTTWSKFDIPWIGVRFADLMALVEPHESATHVMCHAYDHYTTNLALVECMKPDVLLVHTALGKPLAEEHGGPVRMITPQLYAWKGAKWIRRIELMTENRRGFWEERGYSDTAHPWRDDRYS
ncbi:MAG TPA: molybdopterin-dependent oxidoreductase [Polyangiales bacterium]